MVIILKHRFIYKHSKRSVEVIAITRNSIGELELGGWSNDSYDELPEDDKIFTTEIVRENANRLIEDIQSYIPTAGSWGSVMELAIEDLKPFMKGDEW